MEHEVAAFTESIDRRLTQICDRLDGMSAAHLNARPAAAGYANSAWVLAVHALGNARAWVLGIACGEEMGRDRPAEFASSGDDAAELRTAVAAFSREMRAALPALTREDLDRRLVPPAELWGEGQPKEITIREALLHVVEHASLHLGHIEITRDLATGKA